jgi:hypothetical protein
MAAAALGINGSWGVRTRFSDARQKRRRPADGRQKRAIGGNERHADEECGSCESGRDGYRNAGICNVERLECPTDLLPPTPRLARCRPTLAEDTESLVSETHDRTIHQNSGRPNRPSAGAYQQACFALGCNVVTVSDKFSLILFDSLFGPLGQLNIPHR